MEFIGVVLWPLIFGTELIGLEQSALVITGSGLIIVVGVVLDNDAPTRSSIIDAQLRRFYRDLADTDRRVKFDQRLLCLHQSSSKASII